MEETNFSLQDVIEIIKRRKAAYILPFILVTAIAVAVAFVLPSIYRSTSTILIEQREIPAAFVTSSITTFAEQRMQSIHARILTATRLLALIEEFSLYPELQKRKTSDEIIQKMRDDLHLNPVNVEIADRLRGTTATATIAFTLSYDGKNPAKVQQVASKITSLFLKEDIKVRKEQSSSAYDFLFGEKQRVQEQINELEKRIGAFKGEHVESLPELFLLNQQTLSSLERNIDQSREMLRNLKQKKEELEEELNATPVHMEETELQQQQKHQDELRLEMLKMELIKLKTQYSDLYPDVIELKEEIEGLGQKVEISRAKEREKPKNPAYVTLSSRIAGIKSDIESTRNMIKGYEQDSELYRTRIARTPRVEETYNALLAERSNLQLKSTDLQAKMMEARVAKAFESEQKGERFSLVEAARRPEKPFKPNRLAIVLIGIVLGIGTGVGLTALLEFTDTSFRKGQTLSKITGFPVLTEIPPIITRQDRIRIKKRRVILVAGSLFAIVLGIIVFDAYVMNLNVLRAKIERKLP